MHRVQRGEEHKQNQKKPKKQKKQNKKPNKRKKEPWSHINIINFTLQNKQNYCKKIHLTTRIKDTLITYKLIYDLSKVSAYNMETAKHIIIHKLPCLLR